jgi:DNA-binding transcriptional LysR family regulator
VDKIRALRYFLKVVETSSFTLAAKSFSVPASSISRRIRDLESELKVDLFHRSTRVVKLSALGHIYYEQVKDIIASLDHADDFISQSSQNPSGTLRISVMPGYATLVLHPVLEKLNQIYPEIIFDLDMTNRIEDITKNEVDIAIRGTSVLPERAVARKLVKNQFTLFASPDYLKKNGTPTCSKEIEYHRTLLYRGPDKVLHWQVQKDGVWKELITRPKFISNDGLSLLRRTVNGHGISLLPKWGGAEERKKGLLKEIYLKDEYISVDRSLDSAIYLLYLKPRYRISKIKAAVDFLIQELSEDI